jgi:hypothetical protein
MAAGQQDAAPIHLGGRPGERLIRSQAGTLY